MKREPMDDPVMRDRFGGMLTCCVFVVVCLAALLLVFAIRACIFGWRI